MKKWTFMTCGNWDLKICLPNETKSKGIKVQKYFCSWINIKKAFPSKKYKVKKVGGMKYMLKVLKLPLVGRHHSGIDDCKNIAACAIKIMKDGHAFTTDDVIKIKHYKNK